MTSSTGIRCPDVAAFIPRGFVSRKFIMFLKKQGPGNGVAAAREINKSDLFIDHLVSRCHSVHKSRHGKMIFPAWNHVDTLVDVTESFQHPPDTEREVVPLPATQIRGRHHAMKPKAVSRVSVAGPSGSLPPHIIFLLENGFDLQQIKVMAQNDPYFAYCSLEGKIRPLIEFLLDVGVSESDIPNIVVRYPQSFGLSLTENITPKMEFLETLGVDKGKWGKLISRFPPILLYSRQKIEATVEFLHEMGLSEELTGKVITRYPVILGLSIQDQLRPKAEYFQSLGVDVAVLLCRCPQLMGLSMEAKLVPKWEFFLTMDYSRRDLLKHPKYFSYSLDERIKPRYNLMKELGVKLTLFQLLVPSHNDFEVLLKKKRQTPYVSSL